MVIAESVLPIDIGGPFVARHANNFLFPVADRRPHSLAAPRMLVKYTLQEAGGDGHNSTQIHGSHRL